jgi:anti-anti-sigma factor
MNPDDPRRTATTPGPEPDLAQVEFHDNDGVTVATIAGEIDVSNVTEIATAFSNLSGLSVGIVVDLRRLVYLDSSGIALLHDLALRLRQRGQPLVVVSPPSSPPRRVLELTALDSQALVLDDLDLAIESLRRSVKPAAS